MDDQELNVMLWRAFLLGARATVEAYRIPTKEANAEEYINVLGHIAEGNATLANPSDLAALFSDAETRRRIFESEHRLIREDRSLAERVCAGMNADLGLDDENEEP